MKTILPGKTIGIIGGGQLGRMMAIAAKEMGYKIAVMDPKKDSPTGQIADIEITTAYHDLDGAKRLAEVSDIMTYEFENIDYEVLRWLEVHAYLPQGSELIRITKDRANEKAAIEKSGAKVVPYKIVNSEQDLLNGIERIGIPSVLKTRSGGYDGKGQIIIKNQEDIELAKPLLKQPCILEAFLDFDKEVSVIVSRNLHGDTKTFPVAENVHQNHILLKSIVPARVNDSMLQQVERVATRLAESMDMVGTLGVEMFLSKSGEIYINELAPRPHNSGHYSMNACITSQFEQHIRAICNLPLGETTLITPVVMMNLIGSQMEFALKQVQHLKTGKLHLYGKDKIKPKRKMGHINFVGSSTETILTKIESLSIWQSSKQEAYRQ